MQTIGIRNDVTQAKINFGMKLKFNEYAKNDGHLGLALMNQLKEFPVIKALPGLANFECVGSTTFIAAKKGFFFFAKKAEAYAQAGLAGLEKILSDLVKSAEKK